MFMAPTEVLSEQHRRTLTTLGQPFGLRVARLVNRYDVIELNPRKHASAKLDAAKAFADWLVSEEGQQAIGAYQVNGKKLFNPSAAVPR